jgi:hypothetical protein
MPPRYHQGHDSRSVPERRQGPVAPSEIGLARIGIHAHDYRVWPARKGIRSRSGHTEECRPRPDRPARAAIRSVRSGTGTGSGRRGQGDHPRGLSVDQRVQRGTNLAERGAQSMRIEAAAHQHDLPAHQPGAPPAGPGRQSHRPGGLELVSPRDPLRPRSAVLSWSPRRHQPCTARRRLAGGPGSARRPAPDRRAAAPATVPVRHAHAEIGPRHHAAAVARHAEGGGRIAVGRIPSHPRGRRHAHDGAPAIVTRSSSGAARRRAEPARSCTAISGVTGRVGAAGACRVRRPAAPRPDPGRIVADHRTVTPRRRRRSAAPRSRSPAPPR